ncbi:MAG: hypothetical protein JWM71_869 [Solirubrobacteraceae bacterium]|nr:hypothetical protein [Solirubrobacteraceae bacterium]
MTTLAVLALAGPAAAQASPTQVSMFQDDDHLEFASAAKVAKTLDTLQSLGVDQVRVTVFWVSVAPTPNAKTKPKGFDGSDPDAYEQAKWDRYDTLAKLAAAHGISVMWDVAGPAPNWATPSPKRRDLDPQWNPSRAEFGAFVRAIGTRYSGTFLRPADRPKTTHVPAHGTFGLPGYQPAHTVTTKAGDPLPRVSTWEIWNEPNQAGWLAPQWTKHGKSQIPSSPRIYRGLADAMYTALGATGHGADTILLGATAPKGLDIKGVSRAMKPLTFIRDLYCVDNHNEAFRGTAARLRGCPTSDPIHQLPAQHPVLFKATGFSHHPYELTFAPNHKPPDPLFLTIANLNKLSSVLRLAYLRYLQPVGAHGVPIWLTEFGYQTNPPDELGVSPAKQAAYLDEAEYIAWRNPAVQSLSQFLLVDGGAPVGLTFQSGLEYHNGRIKPAMRAYRLPIWLPERSARKGSKIKVWGLIRPAANGTSPTVGVQFRRKGAKAWRTLATFQGTPDRGYIYHRVSLPGTGAMRLLWNGQSSRSVTVRAR